MKIPAKKTSRGYQVGPENTSFGRSVTLVNPSDRDWCKHRYILWFGACGPTRLMVWANGLDDALEESASWLADHAPGHLMPAWGDEHKELVREVCQERGIEFPTGFDSIDDDQKSDIYAEAEADLTLTESGFITSYEWGIDMEDFSRAELDEFLYPRGIDWSAERAKP